MPRRRRASKRETTLDYKYKNAVVGKFVNYLMREGKKTIAEKIFYSTLTLIEEKTETPGLHIFSQAISNVKPTVEVKPRRMGGATYQVPTTVRADRRTSLAIRWIINAARSGKGRTMYEKLAEELILASKNEGTAYKKKENTHKMAEANKAFARFKW